MKEWGLYFFSHLFTFTIDLAIQKRRDDRRLALARWRYSLKKKLISMKIVEPTCWKGQARQFWRDHPSLREWRNLWVVLPKLSFLRPGLPSRWRLFVPTERRKSRGRLCPLVQTFSRHHRLLSHRRSCPILFPHPSRLSFSSRLWDNQIMGDCVSVECPRNDKCEIVTSSHTHTNTHNFLTRGFFLNHSDYFREHLLGLVFYCQVL